MDPVVSTDRENDDGDRKDPDPFRDADGFPEEVHCISLNYKLRSQVADVEHDRSDEDEHCSVEPKLTAALDHLGDPELRSLYGMEPYEEEAEKSSKRYSNACPHKVESQQHGQPTDNNIEDIGVQAEPK